MLTLLPLGLAAAVVLVAASYAVSVYNSLVEVRENISKAWNNIDVLLQQRHDELLKLVDACKGYMKHERELLDGLTKLRVGYDDAKDSDAKARAENELNREVAKLRHVWEGYPDLKASANFLQLQQRVSAVESSIADRREFFNDSVNLYNIHVKRFPDMLIAGALGFAPHAFLEVPEEKKADPKLDFGAAAKA